jgi:hypothetical protein
MSAIADQKEKEAFKKVKNLLPKNTIVLTEPRGSDAGWPDFGFRVLVASKKVDILIEYKADVMAQMGSMRDWKFDGRNFTAATIDENKEMLLELMNNDVGCRDKGVKLLAHFKKNFDPKINQIYSGMLSVESDKNKRLQKLKLFESNTSTKVSSKNMGYNLATIESPSLGKKIIDHYLAKFKKATKTDSDHSILMFMFDNQLFFIHDEGSLSNKDKELIPVLFGAKKIPVLNNIAARLEVRIQPRGLSGGDKAASIDVMASLRMRSKPIGLTI